MKCACMLLCANPLTPCAIKIAETRSLVAYTVRIELKGLSTKHCGDSVPKNGIGRIVLVATLEIQRKLTFKTEIYAASVLINVTSK